MGRVVMNRHTRHALRMLASLCRGAHTSAVDASRTQKWDARGTGFGLQPSVHSVPHVPPARSRDLALKVAALVSLGSALVLHGVDFRGAVAECKEKDTNIDWSTVQQRVLRAVPPEYRSRIKFQVNKDNVRKVTFPVLSPAANAHMIVAGLISCLGKQSDDGTANALVSARDQASSMVLTANLEREASLTLKTASLGAGAGEFCFTKQSGSAFTEDECDALALAASYAFSTYSSNANAITSSRLLPPAEDSLPPAIGSRDEFGDSLRGGRGGTESSNSLPTDKSSRAEAQLLQKYGIEVSAAHSTNSWNDICGYEAVKQVVNETLVLSLKYPEVYDSVSRACRGELRGANVSSSRPRAVLFEGSPGTGKTLAARVIASEAEVKFVHLKVETLSSRWYGEGEKKLADVMRLLGEVDRVVIFLDEIDSSLATSRADTQMHEATRRMLSVLLRHLDGFDDEQKGGAVLVAATNRMQDLDDALISRFDVILHFPLPDEPARREMFSKYAKQLSESERADLAAHSNGLAGRDIRDLCIAAERSWASKLIRERLQDSSVGLDYLKDPSSLSNVSVPLAEYQAALRARLESHIRPHSR
ncbi:Fidgetin-like protein 1 [Porphyridium purpureum]|uniref:Fidgetin-like protein 1 n=1 Tax=Porphyridium purpureum TaxID=35688 RepID=A0A5J4YWC7_PORPP|nr:Fidgetin-like protein 1 [Porphyridium purpureum]|eukprot:POR0507..scf209_3